MSKAAAYRCDVNMSADGEVAERARGPVIWI